MAGKSKPEKIPISQLVLVEGRYDKIKLENILDADIAAVDGFAVYKKSDKLDYIKQLAKNKGVLIATDSDYAGYKIRVRLESILKSAKVSHVFIPNIKGKEKRKQDPSKEGTLGLEGLPDSLLYELFLPYSSHRNIRTDIKIIHLYELGICGSKDAQKKRAQFLDKMGLPHRISNTMLLKLLNERYTLNEFMNLYYT